MCTRWCTSMSQLVMYSRFKPWQQDPLGQYRHFGCRVPCVPLPKVLLMIHRQCKDNVVYFCVTACHVIQIHTLVVGSFGIVEALRVPGNVRTATQSPANNTSTVLSQQNGILECHSPKSNSDKSHGSCILSNRIVALRGPL